jgi:hypothetical protein
MPASAAARMIDCSRFDLVAISALIVVACMETPRESNRDAANPCLTLSNRQASFIGRCTTLRRPPMGGFTHCAQDQIGAADAQGL